MLPIFLVLQLVGQRPDTFFTSLEFTLSLPCVNGVFEAVVAGDGFLRATQAQPGFLMTQLVLPLPCVFLISEFIFNHVWAGAPGCERPDRIVSVPVIP